MILLRAKFISLFGKTYFIFSEILQQGLPPLTGKVENLPSLISTLDGKVEDKNNFILFLKEYFKCLAIQKINTVANKARREIARIDKEHTKNGAIDKVSDKKIAALNGLIAKLHQASEQIKNNKEIKIDFINKH